jgi:hypothetical protein
MRELFNERRHRTKKYNTNHSRCVIICLNLVYLPDLEVAVLFPFAAFMNTGMIAHLRKLVLRLCQSGHGKLIESEPRE